MIDPNNIINYNRTDAELEELILFLVCVAGKKASTVSVQLTNFLAMPKMCKSPFEYVSWLNEFDNSDWNLLNLEIKRAGFGCHTRLTRAFRELAEGNLDLRTCTKEQLMEIHGIGRKSASCFLAWTRKGEEVAMLDTHLLKYLRNHKKSVIRWHEENHMELEHSQLFQLLDVEIPKSTPSSKKLYDRLEQAYLLICKDLEEDPTEYDLEIWRFYSNGLDKKGESATI